MDAGCKVMDWKINDDGFAYDYQWIPAGQLLEDGACIGDDYNNHSFPVNEKRIIKTTIEYQQVRDVDDIEETVSIDLTLTMRWFDPDVRFKFSNDDLQCGGIIMSPEATEGIWIPDIHFQNRTYLKQDEEWKWLISSKISTENEIQLKYEIKLTIYCKFDHSRYPMDEQNCSINIGSGSESEIFVLDPAPDNTHGIYHVKNKYQAANFDMSILFFDNNIDRGNNTIGITITMCRLQNAFIFMYYIPCTTIVLVSFIGFAIPVSVIPGRIGMLVTQFLSLMNLFIYNMVKY